LLKQKSIFWVTAVTVLVLDLASKEWVFSYLGVEVRDYASIQEFHQVRHPVKEILGDKVRLVAMLNPGMMWGFLSDYSRFLLWLRWGAVALILYLLWGLNPRQKAAQLALGGILGGALGNIHDSIRFVGVRDFLEVDLNISPFFDPFPAFNVADSAICIGVAVLSLGLLRSPAASTRRETPEAPSASETSEASESSAEP
jgi:signal peptidase II